MNSLNFKNASTMVEPAEVQTVQALKSDPVESTVTSLVTQSAFISQSARFTDTNVRHSVVTPVTVQHENMQNAFSSSYPTFSSLPVTTIQKSDQVVDSKSSSNHSTMYFKPNDFRLFIFLRILVVYCMFINTMLLA